MDKKKTPMSSKEHTKDHDTKQKMIVGDNPQATKPTRASKGKEVVKTPEHRENPKLYAPSSKMEIAKYCVHDVN